MYRCCFDVEKGKRRVRTSDVAVQLDWKSTERTSFGETKRMMIQKSRGARALKKVLGRDCEWVDGWFETGSVQIKWTDGAGA